ncbi:Na+/H+ antiporter subunit D [Schaalia sp. lx-260]|uniref:Na+/H+ antiporter subunit D n=1 Tax=Schaalia sp. lx-260 TaxID=2899082 RepID=UPI001E362052|nr:Na+/H+ antiporter subunit D [Schaalia sp. lx-260]MCD4548878.1 Na+/H+ antiporter subunit D [Schaalia sp. lx-260]
MTLTWLLPVPVLLPLLFAGLTLVFYRKPRVQRTLAVSALSITTGVSAILAVAAHIGPQVLDVGSWAAPIGITLIVDRLSGTMLLVSQIVTIAVLIYSTSQSIVDDDPQSPVAIYFPTFLILSAGVANAFITGDLFNLFVGFEILLASSFVLITLGATRGRVRAGTVYVVVSLLSSALFLGGIALTYAATGTVNIAQLAYRLSQIDPNVALIIHLVLFVAFGIKAAIFPLHAWLPDSYPTAPGPVTAIFAGLMTKIGVYALIRLEILLFPDDSLSPLLTFIGIATMIVGIFGAVAQDDVKRLLSFVLVSHIGYMLWGLAVASPIGIAATIYYAAHHILVQTTLFLIAALIERRYGTTSLSRMHSLARRAPLLAVMFFISGINLVGIPPFTGFIGKLGLARASAELGTTSAWILLAGGLVTSFLTLYVFIKWWALAFWQAADEQRMFMGPPLLRAGARKSFHNRVERQFERARQILVPAFQKAETAADQSRTHKETGKKKATRTMYVVVFALVCIQIFMAGFSGPLWEYMASAARDQIGGRAYTQAVLDIDGRGQGASVDESSPRVPVLITPNPKAPPLHEDSTHSGAEHTQKKTPHTLQSGDSGSQSEMTYPQSDTGNGVSDSERSPVQSGEEKP